jgi:hypothetical protein
MRGDEPLSVAVVLLITTLFRRFLKVLFRPEEAGTEACFSKGFGGFAGSLSRRTDRWMI